MKLNRCILLLGVDAVRHRNKKYDDDETFTYKTEVQNVAEMSGINEYMTMIEEETKAADLTEEINKEAPKKKGRRKHNISFKYVISAFVTSFGVFTILALILPKPKAEPSIEVSAGPNAQKRKRDRPRAQSIFPSGTNKVEKFIESARDSYHHISELSGRYRENMKRLWDRNKKGDYEEIWSEGENPAYLSDDSSVTTYDAEYQDACVNDYGFTEDSSDTDAYCKEIALKESMVQQDLRVSPPPDKNEPESLLSERAFEKKAKKKACRSCKSKKAPVPKLNLDPETPRETTVDVIFDVALQDKSLP